MSTKREIQLDVLRGVAILLAMGWHLNGGQMSLPLTNVLLYPGRSIGWAGVDLFFVLSGFLVGGLVIKEVQDTRSFDYARFLVRRAFRLWPVLYVYLVSQLLLTDREPLSFVPQVIFHVQNFFLTPLHHLWSLAVEEQFYLVVGLSIPILLRMRANSNDVMKALIFIICVSPVLRFVAVLAGINDHAIQLQTEFRLDGLALGVLLALLEKKYSFLFYILQQRRTLNAFFAFAFFASLIFVQTAGARSMIGYTLAAWGSGFAILAVRGAKASFWRGRIAKWFGWLGVYSYPIYIWHNGVGNVIAPRLAEIIGLVNPDLIIMVKYTLTIAFAFGMAKAVEQPLMKFRDRHFRSSNFSKDNATALDTSASMCEEASLDSSAGKLK